MRMFLQIISGIMAIIIKYVETKRFFSIASQINLNKLNNYGGCNKYLVKFTCIAKVIFRISYRDVRDIHTYIAYQLTNGPQTSVSRKTSRE